MDSIHDATVGNDPSPAGVVGSQVRRTGRRRPSARHLVQSRHVPLPVTEHPVIVVHLTHQLLQPLYHTHRHAPIVSMLICIFYTKASIKTIHNQPIIGYRGSTKVPLCRPARSSAGRPSEFAYRRARWFSSGWVNKRRAWISRSFLFSLLVSYLKLKSKFKLFLYLLHFFKLAIFRPFFLS